MSLRGVAVLALALCASGVAAVSAVQAPSRAEAERMNAKLDAILARSVLVAPEAAPVSTTITDRELNAYFLHYGDEQLPTGVTRLTVALEEGGRLETRSIVDLDAVRTSRSRGWLDPLAYVGGRLEVVMAGQFSGRSGRGIYRHESASVGGVPVPRTVLQELLAFYTKSPDMPQGLVLDEPFDLPAAIREVQVRRGTAIVVQ